MVCNPGLIDIRPHLVDVQGERCLLVTEGPPRGLSSNMLCLLGACSFARSQGVGLALASAMVDIMSTKGYILADAAFGDLIFVKKKLIANPSIKTQIEKKKDFILTNYWAFALNPVSSLYSIRYPEDPGNAFSMFRQTVRKLIQNDRKDLAVEIMRAQFHSVMPLVYSSNAVESLNHALNGTDAGWQEEWKKAATNERTGCREDA